MCKPAIHHDLGGDNIIDMAYLRRLNEQSDANCEREARGTVPRHYARNTLVVPRYFAFSVSSRRCERTYLRVVKCGVGIFFSPFFAKTRESAQRNAARGLSVAAASATVSAKISGKILQLPSWKNAEGLYRVGVSAPSNDK